MIKKEQNKNLEKQEIINELKELKKLIEYIETITEENENYKPLDKKEIELLEKKQTSNCIKNAHLYIISEKIKKLAGENKQEFKTNFKTIISKDKITINCVEDLKPFNALTLNLTTEPPQIETTIYDTNDLIEDKTNIQEKIKKLEELKQELIKRQNYEEQALKKIEQYKKNSITNNFAITPIDRQEIKIHVLKNEITEIEERIENYRKLLIKTEELEQLNKKIDFNDFKKLREILEETLGIDTTKNVVIEQIKPNTKSKIYTIGNKYKVKYIKTTKKLN